MASDSHNPLPVSDDARVRELVADALAYNDQCGPGPVSRDEYLADADAILAIVGAEVDRLREALKRIRDHGETHDEPCWALHNGDCADVMQDIAREALEAGER